MFKMEDKDEFVTSVDDVGSADVTMEETEADVRPFGRKPDNANVPAQIIPPGLPSVSRVQHRPEDMYYNMSGEKHLIIFNHYKFQPTSFFNNKAPTIRKGTDKDVNSLKSVFGDQLGFSVTVYNDLEYAKLWNVFIEMHKTDYSHVSCVCVAILTHGSAKGELYAADRSYELKDVVTLFERITTLANKPKLFFVQACRGKEVDAGMVISYDGDQGRETIIAPSQADFLVMRSTVEDYISYRDDRGSWMIQELCRAIKMHHKEWELLHMITLAQQKVAYYYQTHTPKDIRTHDKKQIPETSFTLTKLVKFY